MTPYRDRVWRLLPSGQEELIGQEGIKLEREGLLREVLNNGKQVLYITAPGRTEAEVWARWDQIIKETSRF